DNFFGPCGYQPLARGLARSLRSTSALSVQRSLNACATSGARAPTRCQIACRVFPRADPISSQVRSCARATRMASRSMLAKYSLRGATALSTSMGSGSGFDRRASQASQGESSTKAILRADKQSVKDSLQNQEDDTSARLGPGRPTTTG